MKEQIFPVAFGIVLIYGGTRYRKYISENKDDFDTPIGKLYGFSVGLIICGWVPLLVNHDE